MSGKSYTMKEMKAIVEYLTEHRAYNEIKGRKMWMELASSKVTNRTWQSLKETFLKRILPDIHNPYYKLSVTQISSFRQGQDIEKRLNNRLQLRSTSKDSTDDVPEKDTEKAGNSNDINEDKTAGEDPKLSNLRASTETLVLENCYETAEDIITELQSPTGVEEDKEPQPTKSMRDLLTYSEPLTPMLQSVIDDFVTDDEEEEPKMEIVEQEPEEMTDQKTGDEKKDEKAKENAAIEISDSEGNEAQEETNQTKSTDVNLPSHDKSEHDITTTTKTKETEVMTEKSTTLLNETKNKTNEKDKSALKKNAEQDSAKNSSEITQNNSASITDTLLPGNQEAFEEKLKKIPEKRNLHSNKNENLENGRKRASSQELEPKTNKKRILTKLKSISDSERSVPTNGKIFEKSKFSTFKQTLPESDKTSSNVNNEKYENTPIPQKTVENSQDSVMKSSSENPCLKNISLYAEQFSMEKYTDSDTSNNQDDKNEKVEGNTNDDNIEGKNNEKTDDKNKKSEDRSDKTDDKNKKGDDAIEKRSDKVENIVDKTKRIDDKNKKLEDKNKQRVENNENAKASSEKAGLQNKKKNEITERTNDNVTDIQNNKNKQKIDNKTRDKNKKDDKPSSTTGQTVDQNYEEDIVVLRSHSESVTESGNEMRRGRDRLVRQKRDSALASMFGFASGRTSRRQRRGTDRRKRTMSHSHKHNYNVSSASSDWTSDTGSEYVSSPPRQYGRKGRHTRKYLKPRSAPILSLEEEGGLFVMYNKKIYPVVKDGKIVKNYVTYTPEDDLDQEESFWKLKYVEEKKKTAELTKLLNQTKEKEQQGEPSRVPPVLPTTAQNSNALAVQETTLQPEPTKNVPEITPVQKAQPPNPTTEEKKTVKIKFIKNNEEVELEGHWSQLNPVLAHVAELFHKQPEPVPVSSVSSKTDLLAPEPVEESGKSTPIEDVVEKVNRREKEIAQEIERYHKEETKSSEKPPQTQNNVTKRRGRPRKSSPAVPPSPAKVAKLDAVVTEQKQAPETTEQTTVGENKTAVATRRTRTPKKLLAENVEATLNTVRTRRSTPRKSPGETGDNTKQNESGDPETDIRYKFPSPPPATRKSYTNRSKTNAAAKNTSQRNNRSSTNLFSPPENTVIDSVESTQGYQDSDISPSSICNKRRKSSLSFKTHRKRYTKRYRVRKHHLNDLITSDSSNSFQGSRIKTMTFQNSTITSEIYRSESYRLLMNNDPKPIKNASRLERILEATPALKDFDVNTEAGDEIATNGNIDLNNKENVLLQIDNNDNSSNVSLPTSPVLSIVENISISKSLLSSMDIDDYLNDDKQENEQIMLNDLMTPDENVAMPLMQQECGIEKSRQDGKAYHYNMSISKTDAAISESFLNKINTVNIQDPSLTETLNVKLKDLLLESAKKMHNVKNTVNNGTKDVGLKEKPASKKTNSKKRSSTPRKRQSKRKQSLTNTEPCIVEEHVESCFRVGRESCPPIILVSEHDGDEISTAIETEIEQTLTLKSTKRRVKKDIIKIKITKPKLKTQNKQINNTNYTDSGINETGSEIHLLQASDDSVELIHNHSETCLNAHECMGDNGKVLDNSAGSIVSLRSNTARSDIIVRHHTIGNISDNQELFSSDAQDGSDVVKEYDFAEPKQVNSGATTVYYTPDDEVQSSPNSLVTDDLSDEILEEPDPVRNTGWYLFTEDEASNTNCFNINKHSEATGYGAKLEHIFPVTCAVPDLSTITELSRETGDSKKSSDDSTRDSNLINSTRDSNLINSPSIFD